jgi:hypothetical protein
MSPNRRSGCGPLLDAHELRGVRSRKGVKKRPTIERDRLYHLVLGLRKEGLSYGQIIRKIEDEEGVRLRKSHLSDWISGRRRPFGYVRAFEATPRPELAYVIGVNMGDASMSVNRKHSYMIKLSEGQRLRRRVREMSVCNSRKKSAAGQVA